MMQPLQITALSAASALGVGLAAHREALEARRSGLRPCDFGGISNGYAGWLDGLDAKLPAPLARFDCRNNRLALLGLRADGFAEAVAAARARLGAGRIGVVVGTSTSGILATEEAYRQRDPDSGALPGWFDFAGTQDMGSLARFVQAALELRGPGFTVSTACASSARAFMEAAHLIEAGICDAVVVGGADSLCRMTLRGFAALELIAPGPCRPCDAARDGISIGEAAGFALLEPPGRAPGTGLMLLGCGATTDGYHMSAPDPRATGAIGAMREALAAAGLEPAEIDYVNLHGTGTRANDAMEDRAVTEVFGGGTPCSSTKGWTGHTLGAAGILEAAISALAMRHGLMPGCLGASVADPEFRAAVLLENRAAPVRRVVSNSFGFGGINCSLVLGRA